MATSEKEKTKRMRVQWGGKGGNSLDVLIQQLRTMHTCQVSGRLTTLQSFSISF